jgi:transposase InsO family protein
MKNHQALYSMKALCTALEVNPAGYYAWLKKQDRDDYQEKQAQQQKQCDHVKQLFTQEKGRYGRERLARLSHTTQQPLSLYQTRKYFKQLDLRAKAARKYKATTQSNPSLPVAPNLLEQNFYANTPNQKWVTDITYLWTDEGWVYLCVILDLFSRRIIGWQMSEKIDRHLVCDTLHAALALRGYPKNVIVHSDRGSQYCSHDFVQMIQKYQLTQSMSKKGDCFDNAAMESWFHSLKIEAIHHQRFNTKQEVRSTVFEYIEMYYNPCRLHSSLDYVSPEKFELEYNP